MDSQARCGNAGRVIRHITVVNVGRPSGRPPGLASMKGSVLPNAQRHVDVAKRL